MKSQYVSDSENVVNNDSVMLLPETMLKCRQEGVNAVNALYGLDIKVRFNSTWELQHEKTERSIASIKSEDVEATTPTREDLIETAESLTKTEVFTFNTEEQDSDIETPTIDDDINKTEVVEVEDEQVDTEHEGIEVTDDIAEEDTEDDDDKV